MIKTIMVQELKIFFLNGEMNVKKNPPTFAHLACTIPSCALIFLPPTVVGKGVVPLVQGLEMVVVKFGSVRAYGQKRHVPSQTY